MFFAALIGRKQPTRGSLEKIPRGSARSWARQSVEICERNCRQPTEYTPTVGRSSFLTLRSRQGVSGIGSAEFVLFRSSRFDLDRG